MSNIVLAWPNYIDEATLTSPQSFISTLPLVNVQDRVFSNIAKTTALTLTINCAFANYRPLGAVALANHNLSINATIRIYSYYDAGQTVLLNDTGDLQVWESVFNSVDLEWEDDNFWMGTPTDAQRALFTSLYYYFLPNNYATKSLKIVITDSGNADGYLKIGRLFAAPYFVPTINASYDGWERGYKVDTDVADCLGTEYFRVKSQRRTKALNLAYLNESEALNKMYMMQKTQGIHKEVLYADSTDKNQYSIQTSFIGRLADLSPLQQPNFAYHGAKINLLEIV